MHIVLYSPSWPPGGVANGIVTYCSHIKPALEQAGHRVSIISNSHDHVPSDDCYYIDENPTSTRRVLRRLYSQFLPRYNYFESEVLRLLDKIDRKHKIDIFEIEESFGWHYRIAKKCDFPVVMRLHGPHFRDKIIGQTESENSLRRIAREKLAFENATYISAPSRYVYDLVAGTYNINPGVSRIIANPVRISSPEKCWSQPKSNPMQLLFVGRFDSIKGGDVVIQMFARFLHRFPEGHLVFVGPDTGIEGEAGSVVKLDEYARMHLEPDQLNRISNYGKQSSDVILKLRAESAVTIVTSRDEVFPYSATEATAMGCPLVASDVGGIPEIITHGQNGLLFESENINDLLDKVSDLVENPARARQLAENGYQACIDRFGSQQVAVKTESFYEECIADR